LKSINQSIAFLARYKHVVAQQKHYEDWRSDRDGQQVSQP